MNLATINIFVNLDSINEDDSLVLSKTNDSEVLLKFKEGDTYLVRVHLRKNYNNGTSEASQLDQNNSLVLVSAVASNAVDELPYLCYSDKFEEIQDSDGDICYEGIVSFATQESLDLLAETDEASARMEVVVRDKLFGYQHSFQGSISLSASLLKGAVKEIGTPAINIGSYSTVVSLASGIVDERILDLRAGAPVEFDTLYELAEYAQRVRSNEILVGDFQSYLDGKTLADQNLTVTQINQLAIDTSTYSVSHEPWMPRSITAVVVE